MRRKIGEQWIEPVIWIAVFIEANMAGTFAALHQLGRCIMMLEIDNHLKLLRIGERQRKATSRGGRLTLWAVIALPLSSVSSLQSIANYSLKWRLRMMVF